MAWRGLGRAPSDETFRQALLATLRRCRIATVVKGPLSGDLPQGRKKRRSGCLDIHEVPNHGQPLVERNEIRGAVTAGHDAFPDYATAYVSAKAIASRWEAWIRQDDSLTDVLQRLLRQGSQSAA